MKTNHECTREALATTINALVALRKPGGPTHDVERIKNTSKPFVVALERRHARLLREQGWKKKVGTHAAQEILGRMDILMDLRADAMTRLEQADLVICTGPRTNTVYTPAAKASTQNVAEEVGRLRSAVGDAVSADTEQGRQVRMNCGVGQPMTPERPYMVRQLAQQQLFALKDPAVVEFLENSGVVVEAFTHALERELATLEKELNKGFTSQQGDARGARDLCQIEVEVITAQLLALITAALGVEERDQLRALLPKTTSRSSSSHPPPTEPPAVVTPPPQEPDPVVTHPPEPAPPPVGDPSPLAATVTPPPKPNGTPPG